MAVPTAARIRRGGALGALAAAVLLATTTTACGPGDDTAAGTSSTPATPSAPATASSAASKISAASPTATAAASSDGPVCKGWSGVDVTLLPGTRVAKDGSYIKVQEGSWTCPRPDAPVWHAIGPRHETRLSATAQLSVNEPFYDTDVNKPIDVRAFLAKADASARASRMYFAYRTDASGTITKLDQRWKA